MTQPISPSFRESSIDETRCERTESDRCAADRYAPAIGSPISESVPPPPVLLASPAESSPLAPQRIPFGLRFCREADSVVEGFLCDEPVVVSDACRKSEGQVDQFLCDDIKMQALQKGILSETWWMVRALLLQLLRPR